MPKHKMTEAHYTVLLMAQDGVTDFGPYVVEPKFHAACLDLMGIRFGEEMLRGVGTRTVAGTTPAGDAALAKHLAR